MAEEVDTQPNLSVENVTREQDGQFVDDSGAMFATDLEENILGGAADAQLLDTDRGSVHAMQVSMERSGADYVQAQRSFLTNSGAREIHSDNAKLTNSGVLSLKSDSADLKQSSAVIANSKQITLDDGRIIAANADKVQLNEGGKANVVIAGDVEAKGDVNSFMVLSGNVQAGGNVTSTMNASTAAILGTVFAIAFFVLGRLFGRKG